MKILISGSTGLVGSALVPYLIGQGHQIVRLVRKQGELLEGEVRWDPEQGTIDSDNLSGIDAVVHLAGENIGAKRWSVAQKQRISDSRVNGTTLLAEALAKLNPMPKVLASASALGYYEDQGGATLPENALPGTDFLAESTQAWEKATEPASSAGIRVVTMRFGLVLDAKADLIKKTLPLFKAGLGGKLGSGRQYMSWIALNDLTRAIEHALVTPELSGPVNMSSPSPLTNHQYTKALGRILSRPTLFAVPAFMLRLSVGEMAGPMTASVRMDSSKLIDSGFQFKYIALESALREILGKP
jgi:uncharacterized protein (TIGR01777 family)